MDDRVRIACLQLTPDDDVVRNTRVALDYANEAVAGGASFVFLPEYASLLHASGSVMREKSPSEATHPMLSGMRDFAAKAHVWVLIGSLTVPLPSGRIANRSFLVSDTGDVVARYDKIHMFDATLPSGKVIRESTTYDPGSEALVSTTPWGTLGLSICYDLRFPQLYRALALEGASMLAVPSAFTSATGPLHWHALLRARAIENAAYVIAPATFGQHPGGHSTFGHSLVVDPLGRVIADADDVNGPLFADLDFTQVTRARASIPSLRTNPPFTVRSTASPTHQAPDRALSGITRASLSVQLSDNP